MTTLFSSVTLAINCVSIFVSLVHHIIYSLSVLNFVLVTKLNDNVHILELLLSTISATTLCAVLLGEDILGDISIGSLIFDKKRGMYEKTGELLESSCK